LLGDPTKARTRLGWKPEYSFMDLVRDMVAVDLEHARRESVVAREGFQIFRRGE
jgi:GDPmannose 4,6-dehydratase